MIKKQNWSWCEKRKKRKGDTAEHPYNKTAKAINIASLLAKRTLSKKN